MSYSRVIPRDLFNEASLLKCLGHLALQINGDPRHKASLSEGDGSAFQIEQDPSDGSIYVANLPFEISGKPAQLYRPLNSREPWPLWLRLDDDDVPVFDLDGCLSREFWAAIA